MKSFKIIDTDIIDNSNESQIINLETGEKTGDYPISSVSIAVTVEIDGEKYWLEFQTSGTFDYGAISSNLEINNIDTGYDKLSELFDDDDDGFRGLIDDIKKKSKAQQLWNEYINENYIIDGEYFGGMDANSEVNRMRKKI
jgi:hypothetical protein